jgi:hypothetical protein
MEKASLIDILPPCPELGAQDDPSISCAYPSYQNTCFHCQKLATPSLETQTKFCLTSDYDACPVRALPADQDFPAQMRFKPIAAPRSNTQAIMIMAVALILGLVIWVGWNPIGQLILPPPTSRINLVLASHPTKTPEPSATPILPTTTRRPRPTVTSTITPTATITIQPTTITRALDLPYSVGQTRFVIHRILSGETLERLARKYNTTEAIIRNINKVLPSPLWAGSVIIISPGMQSIDPALPTFEPYQVPDAAIMLADLAKRLNVEPALLKYYTGCNDPCRFAAREWLVIPRLR